MRILPLPIIVLFLWSGCSPSVSVRMEARSNLESYKAAIENNQRQIQSFTGSGTLSIETPRFSYSPSFSLSMKRPDSVLLKLEGPFGMDIGSLQLSREKFSFFNGMTNELLTGSPTKKNLFRVVNLDVSYDDIFSAFTGGSLLSDGANEPDSVCSIDNQAVIFFSEEQSHTQRMYWFDTQTKMLNKIQYSSKRGEIVLEVRFLRYKQFENIYFPQTIRIVQEQAKRYLSIAYSDLSFNLNDINVQATFPENAKHIELQ
jgi:hypothetical protein